MTPQEYTQERMQHIARLIDDELPNDWGFFIMAFPYKLGPGRCNYVSKARRKDVLEMMKNFIARSEANPNDWAKDSDDSI